MANSHDDDEDEPAQNGAVIDFAEWWQQLNFYYLCGGCGVWRVACGTLSHKKLSLMTKYLAGFYFLHAGKQMTKTNARGEEAVISV
jgi:hypothetical protein